MNFKFFKKENILKLPQRTGVYCFKGNKEILYIGKARNIKERVKNHLQKSNWRDCLFVDLIKKIGFIQTDSEIEALIKEAQLIKKYQPKYNVMWKDDKRYFYVAVTVQDFPQVFITHQPVFKLENKELKFKINYIGPFVDGKALKQALNILRKIFPFRSCKTIPSRHCLWYHLDRCLAPCLLKSKTAQNFSSSFLKIKKDSQRNVHYLTIFFKEGKNTLIKELEKEMKKAAKKQNFEMAAKIRDQIRTLERIISHTRIFEFLEKEKEYSNENYKKINEILKKLLKTKKEISRIEAYDVSNIQGKQAVGSLVVFINGKAEKSFYRRFKIKGIKKPNDPVMLKEIIKRRFKHKEWGLPDLVLIDGGKSQLNAGIKVKNQLSYLSKTRIISLAKKENKLYIENQKEPFLLKDLPREIFNLILQLRDEAHRFAISYHKKLRKKELFS